LEYLQALALVQEVFSYYDDAEWVNECTYRAPSGNIRGVHFEHGVGVFEDQGKYGFNFIAFAQLPSSILSHKNYPSLREMFDDFNGKQKQFRILDEGDEIGMISFLTGQSTLEEVRTGRDLNEQVLIQIISKSQDFLGLP
jgi:hypothetical protein